ncbi:hypothetical protein NXS98_15600 [Fontisphaera persica]|uniref:hypothetical protein n=1 Tax=Fontisphaera persica TaxID=2974023 RepID=UPI0024BFAC1A|nr:hypothetical protein [Fontisphaera persica]WCJ59123.1 hypothetical protein NXS98_15600 [Fontisphaera persica]
MKTLMTGLAVVVLFGAAGCEKKSSDQKAPATNAASGGNPITAPVDYLGAAAQAKRVSEKTVDLAALRQAIQLFYAQEDRYPRDLQELVSEKYLGVLPPPPAGMQFKYNPANGEISIVPKP